MGAAEKQKFKEHRTLRGVFVRPHVQLKFCAILSAGFILLAGFNIVIIQALNRSLASLRETFALDTDTSNLIAGDMFMYLRLSLTASVFFALLGVVIGLWLSRRVYGPMIPIAHHVRSLLQGDYASRVRTREQDEFRDLARDLNTLAERLQNKH